MQILNIPRIIKILMFLSLSVVAESCATTDSTDITPSEVTPVTETVLPFSNNESADSSQEQAETEIETALPFGQVQTEESSDDTSANLINRLEGHWILQIEDRLYGYMFDKKKRLFITHAHWNKPVKLKYDLEGNALHGVYANGNTYLKANIGFNGEVLRMDGTFSDGRSFVHKFYPLLTAVQKDFEKLVPAFFLLKNKKYDALFKYFEDKHAAWENNPEAELDLYLAYSQFEIRDADIRPYFDEFVSAYPDSFLPYLLRGVFLVELGYDYRGAYWKKFTPFDHLEKMEGTHKKAAIDLKKALKVAPGQIGIYYALIDLAKAQKKPQVDHIAEEALKKFPASFLTRVRLLSAYRPRWHGSMKKMRSIVDEAQIHADKNPMLVKLQSVIDAELGDQQDHKGQIDEAIRIYKKSIKKYQLYFLHDELGNLMRQNDNDAKAISHYMTYLKTNFLSKHEFDDLGEALTNMNLITDSIYYLQLGLKFAPNDKYLMHSLFWAYYRNRFYDKSIEVFNALAKRHPDYTPGFKDINRVYKAAGFTGVPVPVSRYQLALEVVDMIDRRYNFLAEMSEAIRAGIENSIKNKTFKGRESDMDKIERIIRVKKLREIMAETMQNKFTVQNLYVLRDFYAFALKNRKLDEAALFKKAEEENVDMAYYQKTQKAFFETFSNNVRSEIFDRISE